MKTSTKIRLASAAWRLVSTVRGLVALKNRDVFVREGIAWELELSQGIDFAIFLFGSFEPAVIKALRREVRPGATVLDIGANIGAVTLPVAQIVGPSGRVLAFEPTDYAYGKLTRNLAHNPDLAARVTTYQCFLNTTEDAAVPETIYSAWPLGERLNDAHEKHLGVPKSTSGACARRLDALLRDAGIANVDAIKLDVDGFELDVLGGATETFDRSRPVVLTELAPYVIRERGADFAEFIHFFVSRGYRFIEQDRLEDLPMEAAALERRIGDGASINVIAKAT